MEMSEWRTKLDNLNVKDNMFNMESYKEMWLYTLK